MIILTDTRQQDKKHDIKDAYFEQQGIETRRTKLYVGDYTLPTNQSVCVDSKASISEVISNVCSKDHERFIREIERAKEIGVFLYVVVENKDGVTDFETLSKWINPRYIRWKKITSAHKNGKMLKVPVSKIPPTNGGTLAKALQTIESEHDNVKFLFCTPEESAPLIIQLLTGENNDGI